MALAFEYSVINIYFLSLLQTSMDCWVILPSPLKIYHLAHCYAWQHYSGYNSYFQCLWKWYFSYPGFSICISEVCVTVTKYLRKTSWERKGLFWLTVLEVSASGQLAQLLLSLWQGKTILAEGCGRGDAGDQLAQGPWAPMVTTPRSSPCSRAPLSGSIISQCRYQSVISSVGWSIGAIWALII